jgi:hypothetical protein
MSRRYTVMRRHYRRRLTVRLLLQILLGHRSPRPSRSSRLPSLQASDPAILDFTEVLGLVDPGYPNAPASDIDLIDTARVLCNSPIGGQALIQQFQQERPVHAVMPGQNDDVIDVVL